MPKEKASKEPMYATSTIPSKSKYTKVTPLHPPKKTSAIQEALAKLSEARKKIEDQIFVSTPPAGTVDISDSYSISIGTLRDYATLDRQHYCDIASIIDNIANYAKDKKRRRPLNILLQAEPGSGKSHFVTCLAKRMGSCDIPMQEVVFNMTTMEQIADLAAALEDIRNIKVQDKLPLLFLDEFDCAEKNYPTLLPLMWDGTLQIGHRDLKLGKVVIVLAGSQKSVSEAIEASRGTLKDKPNGTKKLLDLLSRINGGILQIPYLDEISENRNRKVDKVCISISLLLRRFEDLEIVPLALLKLISNTTFRYGVRSISNLIDIIPIKNKGVKELKLNDLELPFDKIERFKNSPLIRHIICEDGPLHFISLWEKLRAFDQAVRIAKKEPQSPIDQILRVLALGW